MKKQPQNSLSWAKKFNQSALRFKQLKTPLLRFPLLQLAILLVVASGGAAALVITHHSARPAASSATSTTSSAAHTQSPNMRPALSAQAPTTSANTTPATTTKSNTAATQNTAAEQAYQDAKDKLAFEQISCINPMSQINGAFLSSQQSANDIGWSARNAITYAPGTPQFRSVYNSISFAHNFNIELSYNTYISSINTLNSTANCGVSPGYQKYSYWDMLDASGNYVPYIEGSSLSDY